MNTNRLTHIALLVSFAAIAPAILAAEAVSEKPTTTEPAKSLIMPGSLTSVIHDSVTFSTLEKALIAAGLDK